MIFTLPLFKPWWSGRHDSSVTPVLLHQQSNTGQVPVHECGLRFSHNSGVQSSIHPRITDEMPATQDAPSSEESPVSLEGLGYLEKYWT